MLDSSSEPTPVREGDSRSLTEARRHRGALAASLAHWVGKSEPARFNPGSHYLECAWLVDDPGEGATLELEARWQPWEIDLQRQFRRLVACETGRVLLWNVSAQTWTTQAMGCGVRLCPVCARTRAARAKQRWMAVLEAASADGAVHRHWTLTQIADSAPGGLVTKLEAERYGWKGTVADGPDTTAYPCGGEQLGAAYHRLRDTFRAVRQSRKTRDRWKAGLGASILGTEWTGRGRDGTPRWHVHAHVLSTTPPGVEVDEQAMLRDWVRLTKGKTRAQSVRVVDPSAVREVLKYPFKPAALTSAQRIETLAYARGLRPHHVGGPWHSAAKLHREEPWRSWIEARPAPSQYRRLHIVRDSWLTPELYTGEPNTGLQTFALRKSSSEWEFFEGDAEKFARMLGKGPELDPEPGTDLSEGLFEEPSLLDG